MHDGATNHIGLARHLSIVCEKTLMGWHTVGIEEEQMVETGLRGEKITCYGPSTILRAHKNPATRHLVQQSVGLPHFRVIGTIVGNKYLYP